jgi:hypothetical protein
MKFLREQERVELALHKSKTAGRREKRQVQMEFVMKLDGKKISGIQTFIAEAWKQMKHPGSGVSLTELSRMIESQNVRFYQWPKEEDLEHCDSVLTMEAVDLAKLRLEKMPHGEIYLFWTVIQPLGKQLWDWLFHSEQTESLYAEFEECQTELKMTISVEEEKKEKGKAAVN